MREILFRGKRWESECGKLAPAIWLEGSLYYDPVLKRTFIIVYDKHAYIPGLGNMGAFHAHAVTPETVGQYTGLTDKNGKKIFEGDIIYGYLDNGVRKEAGVVVFDDGCWEVHNHVGRWLADLYDVNKPEVIGNIHDNPELMKGGAS